MNTPIFDFARRYAESSALRLHMPGHKGAGPLGVEHLDLTEIDGADSLYEADGIIRESEQNASRLFGSETFYSTEGSSQCIRAMLYLALLHARRNGQTPKILAGRNAHKTFLSGAALLDLDVCWIHGGAESSYLSCLPDPDALDALLLRESPTAVYLTSPDYLGSIADLRAIAKICHGRGALLLVDNAHGAYLRFLPESLHPIDLGADLCCDSAHKTLPVLTGGAYLHISPNAPELFSAQAKNALSLFGSTSPSYLILQSLDAANRYLEEYPARLAEFIPQADAMKRALAAHGYMLQGDEPLKLTLSARPYGYTGRELADILLRENIVCEFCDPDFLVLMFTPETGASGLQLLQNALLAIPKRAAQSGAAPEFSFPERAMSIREAMLSPSEIIPACESAERILAAASVGCPPAVPIVVCGERIDETAVRCFDYYGIKSCSVVRKAPARDALQ